MLPGIKHRPRRDHSEVFSLNKAEPRQRANRLRTSPRFHLLSNGLFYRDWLQLNTLRQECRQIQKDNPDHTSEHTISFQIIPDICRTGRRYEVSPGCSPNIGKANLNSYNIQRDAAINTMAYHECEIRIFVTQSRFRTTDPLSSIIAG